MVGPLNHVGVAVPSIEKAAENGSSELAAISVIKDAICIALGNVGPLTPTIQPPNNPPTIPPAMAPKTPAIGPNPD